MKKFQAFSILEWFNLLNSIKLCKFSWNDGFEVVLHKKKIKSIWMDSYYISKICRLNLLFPIDHGFFSHFWLLHFKVMIDFDRYFLLEPFRGFVDVMSMQRFMNDVAPLVWPPDRRIGFFCSLCIIICIFFMNEKWISWFI